MTRAAFIAFLPVVITAATPLVLLLVALFRRSRATGPWVAALGAAAALLSLWPAAACAPARVTSLMIVDAYALFFGALVLAATFAVALLSHSYLKQLAGTHEEFYVVLMTAALGSLVLASSDHFVSFILGLELLTVSLYVMIAYLRGSVGSLEAGVKYLILAAVSSAFLLFGMALIYEVFGTLQFGEIARLASGAPAGGQVLLLAGTALMVVGLGFKLAVVPFHMWTPDVYQGAAAPVAAFVATASKGAVMAFLVRFFQEAGLDASGSLSLVFALIAAGSMFAGNILALLQSNLKRLLAYSSIAHFGYILVAFVAGGGRALEAIAFYLVVYTVATLAVFGVIALLAREGVEPDSVDDYRGLFWERPWIAGVMSAALLSLAGIPLTAGFIGKYLVVAAGIAQAHWTLVLILVVNSALGLYYYLRVIVAMMSTPPAEPVIRQRLEVSGWVVLLGLGVALIALGVYPGPMLEIIRSALSGALL